MMHERFGLALGVIALVYAGAGCSTGAGGEVVDSGAPDGDGASGGASAAGGVGGGAAGGRPSTGGAGGSFGGGSAAGGAVGSGGKAPAGGGSPGSGGAGGTSSSSPPSRPVAVTCSVTPGAAPPATWKNVTGNLANLASECGNLTLIEADPCSNKVIAGVAKVGLYATADGGASWNKLGTGTGSASIVHRPSSVVFDPEHPDVFYESGIYGTGADGVYRTTDGGRTFTQLGNVGHNDLVSVDFTDPDRKTLLVGTHEQKGKLFLSRDGGATFTDIGSKLPPSAHFSILPLVLDSRHFLLGSCGYGDGECGVYASSDGGETWSRNTPEAAAARPLWASNGGLYFSTIYDSGAILSTDLGKTWTKVNGPRTATPVELPGGRLVTLGSDHLVISSDGGKTWSDLGEVLPFKASSLTYSRSTKTFYVSQWDCGNVVLPDAIASAGFDYER